jgi:hypothetical protein
VPLEYQITNDNGELQQGEVLANVWEHRSEYPPIEPSDKVAPFISVHHPRMIVMTAECDMLWDYQARSGIHDEDALTGIELNHPSILPHILLCEMYEQEEIRSTITGSDIWKRIRQNQDERYHHLIEAPFAGNSVNEALPDLYLDFKKTFSLPTRKLYEGLNNSNIARVAVVPPIYVHDLIHRFYGFLGRVAVPD